MTKPVEIVTKAIDAPAKKAVKRPPAVKKSVAKAPSAPPKKAAKAAAIVAAPVPEPAPALRRGRQPVNPEAEFSTFTKHFKIGARIEGEVMAFTSHGAVIKVTLRDGKHVECYAPTTSLGDPAPARARDVLKRGDVRTFRSR